MPRATPVVAGAGVLLALAALLDGGVTGATPSVRLTFSVPEALVVAAAVVFALAGIVVLVAARGKKKLEEDEPESAPQKLELPWWGQMLAQMILLLPLLVAFVALWIDGGRVAGALLAFGQRWFEAASAIPADAAESALVSLPWLGWTIGLLALAVALATLGVALLLLFAERLLAWWLARHPSDEAVELFHAIDDSLDDLADEPDPRRAIVKCYRRFEHAAARAQVRRAPWQTPAEFMRDAERRLPLPDDAVERLTRLFELARFSDHPLRSVERDAARECLEAIRAALDPRDEPVGVA